MFSVMLLDGDVSLENFPRVGSTSDNPFAPGSSESV